MTSPTTSVNSLDRFLEYCLKDVEYFVEKEIPRPENYAPLQETSNLSLKSIVEKRFPELRRYCAGYSHLLARSEHPSEKKDNLIQTYLNYIFSLSKAYNVIGVHQAIVNAPTNLHIEHRKALRASIRENLHNENELTVEPHWDNTKKLEQFPAYFFEDLLSTLSKLDFNKLHLNIINCNLGDSNYNDLIKLIESGKLSILDVSHNNFSPGTTQKLIHLCKDHSVNLIID